MKRRALLVLALACALAAPAAARTGANVPNRPAPPLGPDGAYLGSDALHPLAGRAASTAAAVYAVPLPAGAVELDSTYYDFQDFGSLGARIVVGPDDRVHVVWEDDFCELSGVCPPNLAAPNPYPLRGMNYAWRDASGLWTHAGRVGDATVHCSQCAPADPSGGFGTVSLLPNGEACVGQHSNEDGCSERGDFYLQRSVGGSTWKCQLTPITDPSYLFPQVVAQPSGACVVLGEVPFTSSSCVHCGTSDFRVSTFASAYGTFNCPTGWQGGAWTAVKSLITFQSPSGYAGFPSMAVGSDGRVGVAVTDFGHNVWLVQSSDGSFAPATITKKNITYYSDAAITAADSTSTQWRPYVHCDVAYLDTVPHVVWSELQARNVGGAIQYFDWHSRIEHWSPDRGVETVYQVPAGVADRYDDVDNGLAGPLAGFNTISVDWPQVGFSAEGLETYVAWEGFTDAYVDPTATEGLPGICTGTGFGDLFASVTRSGVGWAAAQNLTQTPWTDERYFALAKRNTGGLAHVAFQASATNEAGSMVVGDRPSGTYVRRIGYLERRLTASVVGVPDAVALAPVLRTFPNPALGRVRFALPAGARAAGEVEIYAVSGARVARLPLAVATTAGWDGRDASGRALGSGMYLARLAGSAGGAPVKFMLVH